MIEAPKNQHSTTYSSCPGLDATHCPCESFDMQLAPQHGTLVTSPLILTRIAWDGGRILIFVSFGVKVE